ncbi:MAG: class I SAM-dependent methyltransferase [Candidatus Methanomethyliaceae archaeon]
MIETNEGVRVHQVPTCVLCGREGTLLYQNLRDHLFDVSGAWSFLRCPRCGLVWLNPRPSTEEIGRLYAKYCTHSSYDALSKVPKRVKDAILAGAFGYIQLEQSIGWRLVGKLVCVVPTLYDVIGSSVMFLKRADVGKVVDIGCGNGQFLAQMRRLGWQVLGIEPDKKAASVARDMFKIPVIVSTLEDANLPEGCCDVVTIHHVIEHVADPIGLLKEVHRILKPQGKVVVITPNVSSSGHKLFRSSWRGLEPPRHLYLFTGKTLQFCAEKAGFSVDILRTSAGNARYFWAVSRLIRRAVKTNEVADNPHFFLLLEGYGFQLVEGIIRWVWRASGEELLMVADKPGK